MPEVHVSARQEWRILNNAMETLPEKCQKVVEMRRIYGFSQRETAEKLGITEASVEAHIRRGVRRLAEALRDVSTSAEAFINRGKSRTKSEKAGRSER